MTAIGLTCAIYIACLLASGLLVWSVRAVSTRGYGDARRALLAVHRAASAGLIRCLRATLGIVAALLLVWAFIRVLILPSLSIRLGSYQVGYVLVAGLLGALASSSVAYVAVLWARSASLRAVVAAFASTDRLLLTVLRSSLLLTLAVELFGFGICLGIAGVCWVTQPPSTIAGYAANSLLPETIQLLTCFTIGALLASFVLQTSGTTYRLAAQIGTSAASQDANLADTDPRNPSAIAETAGVQLGQLIPQVLDAFCSALCANVLVVLVLWRLVGAERLSTEHAYLLVPVVMRAFGALANVFGTGAARSLESLSPAPAFLRAQAVVVVVALGAIFGCGYWLTPEFSVRLSWCSALGLTYPFVLSYFQVWLVKRRLHSKRTERRTPENPWDTGLLIGVAAVVVPLITLLGLLAEVLHVGASLPLGQGRILALMVCLLGMQIAVPFTVTVQSSLPLIILARRSACLLQSRRDDVGQRRLVRLEDAIRGAASWAASIQTQCSEGVPLLAAYAFGVLPKEPPSRTFGIEILAVISACSVAVILPLAVGFRASSRASRAVVSEVRHQLQMGQRDSGSARISDEFTPSYRACVDVAAREATRQLSIPTTIAVAPGLVLGVALIWFTKNPGLVGQALALFLGQVAIAVLVAGFVFEVAYDFASDSRVRSSRTSPGNAASDCAIHHLAVSSTPSVRLLAKTAVIAALTFVPYMF